MLVGILCSSAQEQELMTLNASGLMVPDLLGAPLTLLPELVSARLLPFTLGALTVLFVPELIRAQYRLKQRGANQRAWPGGLLDPLGLARQAEGDRPEAAPGLGVFSAWLGGLPGWLSGGWWLTQHGKTEKEVQQLQTGELSTGRVAMVSFIGIYTASALTGRGPVRLLLDHLSDPVHQNALQTFLK
eukprot:jgi/Astpho2/65/Aster-04541